MAFAELKCSQVVKSVSDVQTYLFHVALLSDELRACLQIVNIK